MLSTLAAVAAATAVVVVVGAAVAVVAVVAVAVTSGIGVAAAVPCVEWVAGRPSCPTGHPHRLLRDRLPPHRERGTGCHPWHGRSVTLAPRGIVCGGDSGGMEAWGGRRAARA